MLQQDKRVVKQRKPYELGIGESEEERVVKEYNGRFPFDVYYRSSI
jgi:hypothetical protein